MIMKKLFYILRKIIKKHLSKITIQRVLKIKSRYLSFNK